MSRADVAEATLRDARAVLPIGAVEQHAQLSPCVDMILAEKVAMDAVEPLGVPVWPVVPFGHAPHFVDYHGMVTLRVETLLAVMRDILSSMRHAGYRQFPVVDGHGGNAPVDALAQELMADRGDISIQFHNWWRATWTWAFVQDNGGGSHASWMENFPWTRLAHAPAPAGDKPMADSDLLRASPPTAARSLLGGGNNGRARQKPDAVTDALWQIGVEETCAALEGPWA